MVSAVLGLGRKSGLHNSGMLTTEQKKEGAEIRSLFDNSVSNNAANPGVGDLLEVTLQQTLQCLAVTGLVAGHFVDGVVDGIQAVLLGAGSQIELALGCAELAVNAPCQVV